jgi:hypothetical protein
MSNDADIANILAFVDVHEILLVVGIKHRNLAHSSLKTHPAKVRLN